MDDLGFVIEQRGDVRVLAWNSQGCRPATQEECTLWDSLCSMRSRRDDWMQMAIDRKEIKA